MEGSTTIISLVAEGTWVKEGDVLCELDSSSLREKSKQQEISVTQAEAALAQAEEALEIQKKQNESDIAAAELAWKLALLDLKSYKEGKFPQQEKQLSGAVAIADEELLRNRETYEFTKDQVKKGYRTQNDLEAARIAVKQAELKLQGAKEEYKVLTEFTYERDIAELEANSKELERELERTKLKAKSSQTQYEKDVEARKLTYEVEKEQFERVLKQIEACTLKAPQEGEVVYANLSSSRRSSEPTNIEEGATVRERQAIINLPDVTKMKVDCRIHESMIRSLKTGLKAKIRVDAYPDEIFNGEVSVVSSVPMTGSWPNTDLRQYAAAVYLTDEIAKVRRLRPGLTAQLEILIDSRENVLQVPVQSVVTVVHQRLAYVDTGNGVEQRKLKLGESNQTHVEILDGIEEGEEVVLNPRTRFADEIAELEAALTAEESEEMSAAAAEAKKNMPPDAPKEKGSEDKKPAGAGGGPPNAASFMERFDLDKDGSLTESEVPERMKPRFGEMDTDKDGKVSSAEYTAFSAKNPRPGR